MLKDGEETRATHRLPQRFSVPRTPLQRKVRSDGLQELEELRGSSGGLRQTGKPRAPVNILFLGCAEDHNVLVEQNNTRTNNSMLTHTSDHVLVLQCCEPMCSAVECSRLAPTVLQQETTLDGSRDSNISQTANVLTWQSTLVVNVMVPTERMTCGSPSRGEKATF